MRRLLQRHADTATLIIGMYVEQIQKLAEELNIPILTGSTPQRKRDEIYAKFRAGRLRQLVVSKIANFSVDLPDAAVAIQISGTFGSRQEEARRRPRLRPKPGENQAHFYSFVSRNTVEQDFALKRQLFLCEQGFQDAIWNLDNPNGKMPKANSSVTRCRSKHLTQWLPVHGEFLFTRRSADRKTVAIGLPSIIMGTGWLVVLVFEAPAISSGVSPAKP